MKKYSINYAGCLILFFFLLQGCITSRTTTVWKMDTPPLIRYNKLMVVAIIQEKNDSLRAGIETQMVDQLTGLGYYAVSSFHEFGPHGLSDIGEEGTYLKLCDNGIDAVLTLALIDKSKTVYQKTALNEKYTYSYYYNRIWNYRKIQNDTSHHTGRSRYVWETILFDLNTLRPVCVLQTKDDYGSAVPTGVENLSPWFIAKMLEEKIIKKQKLLPVSPRPF